jgi:hypothetical protein
VSAYRKSSKPARVGDLGHGRRGVFTIKLGVKTPLELLDQADTLAGAKRAGETG